MVMAGTYNVALVVGGKTIETKTLKIVADPELQSDATRKQATDLAMELHEIQKRGQAAADALTSVDNQLTDLAAKVKDSKAPDAVKAQFDAFTKEFATVKAKFGVGAQPGGGAGGFGGGGGGGRGGGAPADPANVFGRLGTLKGDLMGFGDMVSDSQLKTATEVKAAMPKAVADANGALIKAGTLSQTLKKYDLTLTVPAPIK